MKRSRLFDIRLSAVVIVPMVLLQGAEPQLSGVVVDANGRPLPFVQITTRPPGVGSTLGDSPTFQTVTNLHGRFLVPDSLIPGDSIWIAALGYQSTAVKPQSGRETLVTLHPAPRQISTANMGLPAHADLMVRRRDGGPMAYRMLVAGDEHELVVTIAGIRCEEFGPSLIELEGSTLTVAVSTSALPRVCTSGYVEQELVLPFVAELVGMLEIRLRCRWDDVVRRYGVRE